MTLMLQYDVSTPSILPSKPVRLVLLCRLVSPMLTCCNREQGNISADAAASPLHSANLDHPQPFTPE
jgi:hypothetical protein